MLCENCKKKKTCTQICPPLEAHLKEKETYMRERVVGLDTLEWLASKVYKGEWYMRKPEFRPILKKCLKNLSKEDRTLITMRFEQGMSYRGIGKVVGVGKKKMERKVKAILEELGEEIVGSLE